MRGVGVTYDEDEELDRALAWIASRLVATWQAPEWVMRPFLRQLPAAELMRLIERQAQRDEAPPLLSAFLRAVHGHRGDQEFTAAELLRSPLRRPDLDPVLDEIVRDAPAGPQRARRLGVFLAQHQGRVVSGLLVERMTETRDGALWRVVMARDAE